VYVILDLPAKFRSNRTNIGGLLMSYRFFQDGGHRVGNLLPSSGFSDGVRSKWWKSICMPNFDEISQSAVEIKLLQVSENG